MRKCSCSTSGPFTPGVLACLPRCLLLSATIAQLLTSAWLCVGPDVTWDATSGKVLVHGPHANGSSTENGFPDTILFVKYRIPSRQGRPGAFLTLVLIQESVTSVAGRVSAKAGRQEAPLVAFTRSMGGCCAEGLQHSAAQSGTLPGDVFGWLY